MSLHAGRSVLLLHRQDITVTMTLVTVTQYLIAYCDTFVLQILQALSHKFPNFHKSHFLKHVLYYAALHGKEDVLKCHICTRTCLVPLNDDFLI